MPDNKKNTANKKGEKTKKGGMSKKVTGTKNSNKKGKQKKLSFYEEHRTTLVLIYIVIAVLLLFVAFIPGYNIWAKIRGAFFGFFGIGFYVFDACLLILGIRMALDNLRYGFVLSTVSGFGLSTVVSSITHLFLNSISAGGAAEWANQLKNAAVDGFYISEDGFIATGGVLGGFFGGGSLFLLGKAASFVILAVLLAVFLIIFIGVSFSSVGNGVSDFIVGSKEKIGNEAAGLKEKHTENKARRRDNRKIRNEQKQLRKAEILAQKEQQESSNDFDFATSDVSYDFDKKDEPVNIYKRRKMVHPQKNPSIFTKYIPPENLTKNTVTDQQEIISANEPIEEEPNVSEIEMPTSVDMTTPESDPEYYSDDFEEVTKELSSEAQSIVDAAVSSAEKNARKNMQEVAEYRDDKQIRQDYKYPPIDCLQEPDFSKDGDYALEMQATAKKLVDTLKSFGVETNLIGVSRGPSVTRYELQPAPGVKISKITNLADDIALNLASSGVRIEAPIPNKSAVGIEVPNQNKSMVTLREIISSSEFKRSKSKLNVALGKDITGGISCADLAKMPHLLIAGTTGSGKSVCLNCMIVSILYNAKPTEVKLLMIDPKQVEFSVYNGIPHLLVPVISDARKAAGSLAWAVGEMEKRYKTFSACGVRDIGGFNKYILTHPEYEFMPQIVIFIDELNDLMMISPKEVEDSICRLAQKARAAGMHLVVATQRPSVDVITGIIKANIPSRISLSVSSQVDSRTILDAVGAEKLLGNGDMLYNPVGVSKPVRIQGGFVSDGEIEEIVDFIKNQAEVDYSDDIMDEIERNAVVDKKQAAAAAGDSAESADGMVDRAIQIGVECEVISVSLLQRKLRIGYARAARIVDELDERGLVGPSEGGGKPRKFLMNKVQYMEIKATRDNVSDAGSSDDGDFDIFSD